MSDVAPGPLVEPLRQFAQRLNDLGWSEPADSTWSHARQFLVGRAWAEFLLDAECVGAAKWQEALHTRLPGTLTEDLLDLPHPDLAHVGGLDALALPGCSPARLYELLLGFELTWTAKKGWALHASPGRRNFGSHYTPNPIADMVVDLSLKPLLADRSPSEVLELEICDPTMGAGVFLMAAARYLARAVQRGESRAPHPAELRDELAEVCAKCLCGIDIDANAVLLTRLNLWHLAGQPSKEPAARLRRANALLDQGHEPPGHEGHGIDLRATFPDAFSPERGGFDAIIGNPPWVAYVGRATQPLEAKLKAHYAARFVSFKRYRTLHGVFTERCASLLRPGGRLGLVLPTSMADLDGYAPTRAAHDMHCLVDDDLPDLGDGRFEGVFQPCMALLSTRRLPDSTQARPWRLTRTDLDDVSCQLLSRLATLPKVPSACFGERGYQTTREDKLLLESAADERRGLVPLLSGTEVGEFRRSPPRFFADPHRLTQKLRAKEQWQGVSILIRQTARYPIAAASDGLPFRNSLIAGFPGPQLPAPVLLCYLNSNLVRWYHYHSQRDARQGMPQLKVGHLRALPQPPDATTRAGRELEALGVELSARNRGCRAAERRCLDTIVYDAFSLDEEERAAIEGWASAHPLPKSRRGNDVEGIATP